MFVLALEPANRGMPPACRRPQAAAGAGPDGQQPPPPPQPESAMVDPVPGFCVKTESEKREKTFINMCHAAEVVTAQPPLPFACPRHPSTTTLVLLP